MFLVLPLLLHTKTYVTFNCDTNMNAHIKLMINTVSDYPAWKNPVDFGENPNGRWQPFSMIIYD